MDHLLNSKRSRGSNEDHVKLQNLSPQKYGKAAYAELTYTPSKLADNLLYREVTTLKKMEQGNGKLREIEAINSLFQDRLDQLKEQRDGIQESLTAQIKMYKKLLQECQLKSEARIKEIQASFKEQIRILIEEKEQEAKYAQSQKQLLENRIQQLQGLVASLRDQLSHSGNQFQDLKNAKEKLDIKYENVCNKLADTQQKMKKDSEQAKQRYQDLSRKFYNAEVDWKRDLENAVNKKDKQIQNLQRLQRTELQKIQNKRSAQNLMKNQQIKDITSTFQAEAKRMNQIINMKDRMIDNLNKDLSKQKQKILDMTRSYQKEITDLAHEKSRLLDELDDLGHENTRLTMKLKDHEDLFEKQRFEMEGYIRSLKDELQLNQVNYVREKDKSAYFASDLERQISSLRAENTSLRGMATQNQVLTREVRNLRQLLLESSNEMQKCKEEFIRMGKERDVMYLKLREANGENDALHRIKYEKQEEARGWKESYYLSKRF